MAKRLFGTDGIRGVAGEYPLDDRTVTALGIALADDLNRRGLGLFPVLIGMDTRESGPALAARLADGIGRRGIAVEFVGVLTTPGVAYLTRTGAFSAGVMISASHNPFQDNGIKIFAQSGFKLPDVEEHEVEEEIFQILEDGTLDAEPPAASPTPLVESHDVRRYLNFLLATLSTQLDGFKIVMDCGNGAAAALAPALFREAGAEVVSIFDEPNGRNINLGCGALHLEQLQAKVLETGADAGVAFDGDADRCLMVAKSGKVVDGDAILLIAGGQLKREGKLPGDVVVSTVMSNLGLEKALERIGVAMVRTPVGDKYVLEDMVQRGAALGGEQSGHIIFQQYSTTGDGMLTALKVLETCAKQGKGLDELASDMTVFPQLLKNVRVKERRPLAELPGVLAEIAACEAELAGSGRILVRFSGTELLLRVMVEGMDQALVESTVERIIAAIKAELG
jgi:phosphoglucosamine mutase